LRATPNLTFVFLSAFKRASWDKEQARKKSDSMFFERCIYPEGYLGKNMGRTRELTAKIRHLDAAIHELEQRRSRWVDNGVGGSILMPPSDVLKRAKNCLLDERNPDVFSHEAIFAAEAIQSYLDKIKTWVEGKRYIAYRTFSRFFAPS
jgi:hypothetical protein